jgi:predicted alpha/beta-hydrolase family hydrolase
MSSFNLRSELRHAAVQWAAVTSYVAVREFTDLSAEPSVRGFLHTPADANGHAVVLTHGAGSNCQSRLLHAVADSFATAGFIVLRCDLAFRQKRPHGPPFPAAAAQDRAGLARAVEALRPQVSGQIFLGGHSYGGRQASMLCAEKPDLTSGLLLLSYPLHPPRKPQDLRTAHFSNLKTPALFIHGSRDPFGSAAEMESALQLIPARHHLHIVEGVGHELIRGSAAGDLPAIILKEFSTFVSL